MPIHPQNKTVSLLGFWSAVFCAFFAIAYIAAEGAHLIGWLGTKENIKSYVPRMLPSILLAIAFVILMVSILNSARSEKRVWAQIGFAFSIIYTVLVSIVYFVVMAVLVPYVERGESAQVVLLQFKHGTFLFAIDILGYGFMSLATLFAAPVFGGSNLESWIRRAMIANGLLAPAIVFQIFYPSLWNIALLWAVTFPTTAILLSLHFRRLVI